MSTTTKSAIQTATIYALERLHEMGPGRAGRVPRTEATDATTTVEAPALGRSVAQLDQLSRLAQDNTAPSKDPRYSKFVEAVRALRVDLDLSSLSQAQIDRILESASRLYLVNDGIPEPVEPMPIRPPAQHNVLSLDIPGTESPGTEDAARRDELGLPKQVLAPDRAAGAPQGDSAADADPAANAGPGNGAAPEAADLPGAIPAATPEASPSPEVVDTSGDQANGQSPGETGPTTERRADDGITGDA